MLEKAGIVEKCQFVKSVPSLPPNRSLKNYSIPRPPSPGEVF